MRDQTDQTRGGTASCCPICRRPSERPRLCPECRAAPQDEASQLARIDAILEAERLGVPLPERPVPRGGALLPTEPLRRAMRPWLLNGTYELVGRLVGLHERRVRATVAEATVEQPRAEAIIVRLGLLVEDVYPDGPDTRVGPPPPWLPPGLVPLVALLRVLLGDRSAQCADPGCHDAADAGRFCAPHAARLGAVRDQLRGRRRRRPHGDEWEAAA